MQVEAGKNEIPESRCLETAIKKEAWLHDGFMFEVSNIKLLQK